MKISEALKDMLKRGEISDIHGNTFKVSLTATQAAARDASIFGMGVVQTTRVPVGDVYCVDTRAAQEARNKAMREFMDQLQRMHATSGGPTGWIGGGLPLPPGGISAPYMPEPPAPPAPKIADKRIDEMTHLDYQKCCANFFKKQSVWT